MSLPGEKPAAALVVDGLTAGYGGGDVLHGIGLTVAEGAERSELSIVITTSA